MKQQLDGTPRWFVPIKLRHSRAVMQLVAGVTGAGGLACHWRLQSVWTKLEHVDRDTQQRTHCLGWEQACPAVLDEHGPKQPSNRPTTAVLKKKQHTTQPGAGGDRKCQVRSEGQQVFAGQPWPRPGPWRQLENRAAHVASCHDATCKLRGAQLGVLAAWQDTASRGARHPSRQGQRRSTKDTATQHSLGHGSLW